MARGSAYTAGAVFEKPLFIRIVIAGRGVVGEYFHMVDQLDLGVL